MKLQLSCGASMLALLAIGQLFKSAGDEHVAYALWTLAMIPIAFLFYRMRQRSKLIYGGFELVVAIGFFYFLVASFAESEKLMSDGLILSRMLTFFAAIYFMVRAIENIGTGVTGTRFEKLWTSFSA